MKSFVLVGFFVVIQSCLASPTEPRWNLIPNGDGKMHLIDVQSVQGAPEPFFNAEADTAFLLFTRSNPTAGRRITWSAESIRDSNFNSAHPVRFLIHGFNSGPTSGVNTAATAAYLQRGDFNVIVVDWSIGASTINYVSARNRVPEVANQLARFLNFITANGFTQWDRVNVAGHSLGAHIAGVAGKRTNGRIQVIFGLDPAGPLFSLNSPEARLAENDAVYTEGIRTNSNGATSLGFLEPLTHADFYPHWGRTQPGCGIDAAGSCSHSRSHQLFAEAINTNRFIARRCVNFGEINNRNCPGTGETASMGIEPGNIGLRGVFFLETNSNAPFARG